MLDPADYDVVVEASLILDGFSMNDRSSREIARDQLRLEVESRLPDGYTLADCVYSEYEWSADVVLSNRFRYTVRAYL